jgi:5-methylthioadenosine/S-adenosylhomocysteine deaminase
VAILFKGATILTMTGGPTSAPVIGDLLIDGDIITAVGAVEDVPPSTQVIDGRKLLVTPGFVNAHLHSWELPFKGRYANLPHELWGLYTYPFLSPPSVTARFTYLRTMVVAIEALKNGVTCVIDDGSELTMGNLEALGAAFQAYADIGMRANCSGAVVDRSALEFLPYAHELLPGEFRERVRNMPLPSVDDYVRSSEAAISQFHDPGGRLRYVVSPVAPQWCTDDMLVSAHDLATTHDLNYHTHVLETKTQAISGPIFYGKTLVRYLDELGVLDERTTLAHAVWVTDDDIVRIASAGAAVVHNPISNLILGSGVAPFRKLAHAGIVIGLGTDGVASNDTARLFDVIRIVALLHNLTSPDYESWPEPGEVLRAATLGGARCALLDSQIGSIEVGKKADLVTFDLTSSAFTPLNDVQTHLTYCENGSSIDKVIVDGEILVDGGSLTKVDEVSIFEEFREHVAIFLSRHEESEQIVAELEPYFAEIYRRCSMTTIGINRYSAEQTEWNWTAEE